MTSVGHVVSGSCPAGQAAVLGPARRVRVGDVTLGYRQVGAGPPLLLVAGQNCGMNAWGVELPRRLAAHAHVTMFDNRGVGYSSDDPHVPLTIETMADDTAGLLRALGVARAYVLGWSTGGEVALALAVRHPDVVAALVLSGATAGGPSAVQAVPEADALLASDDRADEARLLTDYLFTRSGQAAMNDYVRDYLSVPGEAVGHVIKRRQAEAQALFARHTDVYDGLPRITAPTLVTNGALDALVPPQNARIIANRIPHARSEIFDDSAHAMMFQDMDRFVALLESFLGLTE